MKTKRKILSFLLTLTLIITLIPVTVFAKEPAKPVVASVAASKYIAEGYEVEFKVTSQWSGAFNGEFILTNTGDKALENWALGFDFQHQINSMWNGTVVSHEGSRYTIKNLGWNQDIAPGQKVSIGFQANWSNEITAPQKYDLLIANQQVSEADYGTKFKVTSDWGKAFNGEITITNISQETIEDWTLEFDFDKNIERFWTATILEHTGTHYVVKNAGYNANIAPGKTITLGFSGNPGNVSSEPNNYKLTQIGQVIDYTRDSDGDGLPDMFEKEIGTSTSKSDTDIDGLPDGYEYKILGTSPLKLDTDSNGKNDGDEDFDKDGVSNLQEYKLGTDPNNIDTDCDGLNDKEEIEIHKTNPTLYDTDKDGISDGDEIKLGLNPLFQYTHSGVKDSDYSMEQKVGPSTLENINKDNKYELSVEINAAGLADSSLTVEESSYANNLADNDAILGKVISLDYDNLKLENAELNFKIDSSTIEGTRRNFPLEEGFKGIQRYQVFRYDETYGVLYPVQTVYDTINNVATAETATLGHYCVIDMDQWLYGLGVSPDSAPKSYPLMESKSLLQSAEGVKEDIEVKDDVLPENYDEIMMEQINKACGIQQSITPQLQARSLGITMASTPTYNKQIDLVYVLDTSGSMSSKINQCKTYMKNLVQNLYNEGITARVAVISFNDINKPIKTYEVTPGEVWAKNPEEASQLISQVSDIWGGIENHVDALETTLGLSYRSNTTRFAVMVTDEPLTTNDNNSKIGASGIADKLAASKIITSVVCSNYHAETFRPIFEKTNGIQISVTSTFNTYLEIFIKTVMRDNNVFLTVVPNSLSVISLNVTPTSGGTTDTDGDGLADSKEIDWTMIKEENGNLLLPTIREYLNSLMFKDIETFVRLSKEKADIINSMVVLPIKSNPAKEDGDGDEYKDPVDPRPLRSDVIKAELRDADNFVKVVDGSKNYYGGDQDWFDFTVGQYGGCGTVAAANITAYFARYRSDCSGLYNYNASAVTRADFIKHMNEVYEYVTPRKIPFVPKGAPPVFGFGWTVGIWPLSRFTDGLEDFADSRNVDIEAYLSSAEFNKDNVTKYIMDGLNNNSPVALLIGNNTKLENIEITTPDRTWSQAIKLHWVTITEIKQDFITDKTTVKVSTWGGYAYIDLEDFIDGEKVYEALVYFK